MLRLKTNNAYKCNSNMHMWYSLDCKITRSLVETEITSWWFAMSHVPYFVLHQGIWIWWIEMNGCGWIVTNWYIKIDNKTKDTWPLWEKKSIWYSISPKGILLMGIRGLSVPGLEWARHLAKLYRTFDLLYFCSLTIASLASVEKLVG